MTERWEPDDQLVPAVLAHRPQAMTDLSLPDRCWVVAGLTLAGLTAEDIAARLSCSLRLVRALRAEDMTRVCQRMQQESSTFADELRLSRSEHRAAIAVADAAALEVRHLRSQLVRLTTPPTQSCSRGHDMSGPYAAYTHAPTGRRFCRECHRERQATYRARRRVT